MSNSYFQFKQFTIHQDRCAMKVGTDGVVVGVLANHPAPYRILDIGTGTGLIALMMAQRFPDALVDAVEIDEQAALQAIENAQSSPFVNRVNIYKSDINDYKCDDFYDLIISNPPYYENSLLNPDAARAVARHTLSLSFDDLSKSVARLINPESGVFTVIIPADVREQMRYACELNHLYLISITEIRTVERKSPKRVVMQFSPHKSASSSHKILILQNGDGGLTSEFQSLVNSFYLDKI